VDLIYLDPPFNSNANYNVLFKSPQPVDLANGCVGLPANEVVEKTVQ
jgi:16S rRNA G966 N2-methylase RsmD